MNELFYPRDRQYQIIKDAFLRKKVKDASFFARKCIKYLKNEKKTQKSEMN